MDARENKGPPGRGTGFAFRVMCCVSIGVFWSMHIRKSQNMKVVIAGGVAGGASCTARLRRLDETAQIQDGRAWPVCVLHKLRSSMPRRERDRQGIKLSAGHRTYQATGYDRDTSANDIPHPLHSALRTQLPCKDDPL